MWYIILPEFYVFAWISNWFRNFAMEQLIFLKCEHNNIQESYCRSYPPEFTDWLYNEVQLLLTVSVQMICIL